jgi:hypothetical protein
MRNLLVILLLSVLLAVSCTYSPEVSLQVNNPMNQERSDATILLSRGEISRWLDIPSDLVPVLTDLDGTYIPCQADDVNGDGQWDELFALVNMEARGSLDITISFIELENYPEFPVRTNLHLGDATNNYQELSTGQRLEGITYHNYAGVTEAAYQMEGVAWENDRAGFRNYMDQRNGMDIFGKTTTDMVLEEVGIEGAPSYHEPGEWGMDVLKVGTSLGAGGIAYLSRDSLYRVGDSGSGSYTIVFQGPLRSRFRLDYTNWKVGEEELNVSHQIQIVAGRHCYGSLVIYSGTEEHMDLVPGIVNMKSDSLHFLKLNEQYSALLTHDKQSEDGSLLTMALIVPASYLNSTGKTSDEGTGITQTYYARLEAYPDESQFYRFYSFWEKQDPRWSNLEEVKDYLRTEAERLSQSLIYYNSNN